MATTTPVNGLRVPTQTDGPLGGVQIANLGADVDSRLIGRFATVAERNTAWQQWSTQTGQPIPNGAQAWCETPGSRFVRTGGQWVSVGKPTTLRSAIRHANNVLAGGAQGYGSASNGRLVIPAASDAREVSVSCHVDIYCNVAAATAGSVFIHANSVNLLATAPQQGTFHNQGAGIGAYIVRPVTAHAHWEGVLPAGAQNIWVNVTGDAGSATDPQSQPFWVTSVDLTVVYR